MDREVTKLATHRVSEATRSAMRAYQSLIERLVDTGFSSRLDLQKLNHADLAVVLRHRPELLALAFTDPAPIDCIARELEQTRTTPSQRWQRVGVALILNFQDYLFEVLLEDVRAEGKPLRDSPI